MRTVLILSSVFAAVALASIITQRKQHALRHRNVVATPPSNTTPCFGAPYTSFPYCNQSLTIADRIANVLARLEPSNYPFLFGNSAGEIEQGDLYLPSYQWWSEGLHGVANSPGVTYTNAVPSSTSFPQVCTTGASFDRDLFTAIGDTIGKEGRAMNNLGQAGLTFWAPNINIYRDPRWGRGQETPGEDPYLTSVYAMHFVRAMQNNSMDPTRLRVSSCCKHFTAYDLENWGGQLRYSFDANVSEYDLANTFLPPFEACMHAEGGAASGTMCSYNAVNGIPMCASPMLQDVARNWFGFNGYITSDCGATSCTQYDHHYTKYPYQTIDAVLNAGEDLDCGSFITTYLTECMANNSVAKAIAEKRLGELLSVQMRLGMFDAPELQPFKTLNASDVDTPEARALALRAAEEGIVLLENNNGYLPLDPTSLKTVAVIGPNAASGFVMLGNYFGQPPYNVSVLEGVQQWGQEHGFEVLYAQGMPTVTANNYTGFDEACSVAAKADVVIMAMGIDQTVEAEGNDRDSIGFPGFQDLLVLHVMRCTKNPVVVVTLSGGSLDYSNFNQDPRLGGLLWAGYPGQSGGTAIANIIFGAVSPSGRLPHTVYPAAYTDQVEMSDMRMESDNVTDFPGRTYRYYVGPVVYPFGWMHTYTNFSVVILNNTRGVVSASRDIEPQARPGLTLPMATPVNELTLNVTNVGRMASGVSLVLKITNLDPGYDVGGTVSDFTRVHLAPGESAIVTLYPHLHSVLHNPTGHPLERRVRRGKYGWSLVGPGFDHVKGSFEIVE
jgi:beta-glucosidase-like glycosyl hydrolase